MIACISSALYFNPHLPCGRRLDIKFYLDRYEAFQSTPSLRKATFIVIPLFLVEIFQSTPSLRKATIPAYDRYSKVTFQSTPSLRKATTYYDGDKVYVEFQSTPSLRKATISLTINPVMLAISIHTFLAEGDYLICFFPFFFVYFNPHLPCGRRLLTDVSYFDVAHFNPHLPCGRRRFVIGNIVSLQSISIHTFLAEGDKCIAQ